MSQPEDGKTLSEITARPTWSSFFTPP